MLRRAADEQHRRAFHRAAQCAEHRARIHRLRRDRAIGVAHLRHNDHPTHQDHLRLGPKKGRFPQHQIGAFADRDAADMLADPVHDGGVDGVFRDIAADAEVVVIAGFLGQPPALLAHLVGGLPCAGDDLAHAAHGLAIGRDHRKRPHVMQDIFGGDRFAADAAFGESNVFGDTLVKVMADHQHIEMLFHRVYRIGHGRVGRGRQDVLRA